MTAARRLFRHPARRRGRFGFHARNRLALSLALIIIALPLADAGLTAALGLRTGIGDCRVLAVTDGDTVTLWCPPGAPRRARLVGFDTPEVFSPRCAAEWWAGMRATAALRLMLWRAAEVRAVRQGTDRYDRALVSLFVDGQSVARRMIAAGHARPYAGGRREGWCAPRDPDAGRLPQIGRG